VGAARNSHQGRTLIMAYAISRLLAPAARCWSFLP